MTQTNFWAILIINTRFDDLDGTSAITIKSSNSHERGSILSRDGEESGISWSYCNINILILTPGSC
jgi:hypothetical protein